MIDLSLIVVICIYLIASNSCRGNWYYTSQRCQKLLLLIMNKIASLCKITASKIVILTIKGYAAVSIRLYYYVFKFSNRSLLRKSYVSSRLWKRLCLTSLCFAPSSDNLAHLSIYSKPSKLKYICNAIKILSIIYNFLLYKLFLLFLLFIISISGIYFFEFMAASCLSYFLRICIFFQKIQVIHLRKILCARENM